MDGTVDVTLAVTPETARVLSDPVRRREIERLLDALLRNESAGASLMEAMVATQHEAQANGLTDEIVDAELDAWRNERRNRRA